MPNNTYLLSFSQKRVWNCRCGSWCLAYGPMRMWFPNLACGFGNHTWKLIEKVKYVFQILLKTYQNEFPELFIDRHLLKKFPLDKSPCLVVMLSSSPCLFSGQRALPGREACPCSAVKPPCSALTERSRHLKTEWICHACDQVRSINLQHLLKSPKPNQLKLFLWLCFNFKLGLRGERSAHSWQPI